MRHVKIDLSILVIFFLFIFTSWSEAGPQAIALNPAEKNAGLLEVYQNAYVKISNTYGSALYDLIVSESLSEKRVLSIADFQSGQSLDLSFSKAGEYKICYSSDNLEKVLRTCVILDVLKGKLA